jgi:hypothetical protein
MYAGCVARPLVTRTLIRRWRARTLSMQAASFEDLPSIASARQTNHGRKKSAMGSSVEVQFSESELHSRSVASL